MSDPSVEMLAVKLARRVLKSSTALSTATLSRTTLNTTLGLATVSADDNPNKDGQAISKNYDNYTCHAFSIAPMMDWTDRHYRYLARMLTVKAQLYTEMVSDNAVIFGNPQIIDFAPIIEDPVVLQLGGSTPAALAQAAAKCVERGYSEINLNVGCPSDRGQGKCSYGAVLMHQPELVADCMSAIMEAVPNTPCTVKCRIGVGPVDDYAELRNFIKTVHEKSGKQIAHYIIHARRAILGQRLTPEQNRKIPKLHYEFVYKLIDEFPELKFTVNGGILTIEEVQEHLRKGVHGVMVGRAAYKTPWAMLKNIDSVVYGEDDPGLSRRKILDAYGRYAERVVESDPKQLNKVLKPLVHLFAGEYGGSAYRRALEMEKRSGCGVKTIIDRAMAKIDDSILDAR